MLAIATALLTALGFVAYMAAHPAQHLTQKDIDAAVLQTLKTAVLPSPESKAYARIRPSVVRVVQEGKSSGKSGKNGKAGKAEKTEVLRGVGSGVVVIDNGTILTCLHVIEGGGPGSRLRVQFANGMESDAVVVSRQPEKDLAVIRAVRIPDDLVPATLRPAGSLAPGDKVLAVGFPFNIGPSVSSGIISGLHRDYAPPDSKDDTGGLHDLIQFDAAANPGNSGGPLVTMQGEVVGLVSAILSPHEQGTFIGIGFAVPIEAAAGAVGESPF